MKKKYPNLFIPGAGKSGTSSLHELLNQHPDICMSSTKEPHFWTRLNFEDYETEHIEKYLNLFVAKNNALYRGESSTGYMQFPNFIERIKAHYDASPKFIFLLRNPIDRCYSHYWWLRGLGSEKKSFKDAFLNDFDIEPTHETKLPEANYKSYHQYGLYYKWLSRFYKEFEASDIKIITHENLKNDRLNTLNSCFSFLNLSALEDIPEIHSNKTAILKYPFIYKYAKLIAFNQIKLPQFVKDNIPSKVKFLIRKHLIKTAFKYTKTNKVYPKISSEEREFILNFYKDDVNSLRQLTGKDFSEWEDFN